MGVEGVNSTRDTRSRMQQSAAAAVTPSRHGLQVGSGRGCQLLKALQQPTPAVQYSTAGPQCPANETAMQLASPATPPP